MSSPVTTQSVSDDVAFISSIPMLPTLLKVICHNTGMGFAAVARVTETQWVACAVRDEIQFGLKPGGELELNTTICNEIKDHLQEVVIDNVSEDELYCDHHTPKMYGFQSYISVPIKHQDGTFFGTLCAIDPLPRKLDTPNVRGMFKAYADLISFHLDAVNQLEDVNMKLINERHTSELREEFIAVLGHDLRNPLGAVSAGAQLLSRMELPSDTARVVKVIKDSSFRMTGLIANILDFARGRLGGGISLDRAYHSDLGTTIQQLIDELKIAVDNIDVQATLELSQPIFCDKRRVSQLLSNLLGNALQYSDKNTPIHVNAAIVDDEFILTVTNRGAAIPVAVMPHLFKPFSRGAVKPEQDGLGLGLYIAYEIATSHGGTMKAASEDGLTTFSFTIPVNPK